MNLPIHTDALEILQRAKIASPCPVRWEEMTGDDRVRTCAQCKLRVYNLSAMTADESAALLIQKKNSGESICAQIWRRADGSIITADCPVGWRRNLVGMFGRTAALITIVLLFLQGAALAIRNQFAPPSISSSQNAKDAKKRITHTGGKIIFRD